MGGPGSGGQNKTPEMTAARIVNAVEKVPGLTSYMIGRVVGVPPRTVEVVLYRLAEEGRVRVENVDWTGHTARRVWYPVTRDLVAPPGSSA